MVKKAPAKGASGARSNHKKTTAAPAVRENTGRIEKRAYELFIERVSTGVQGNELSDWLKAEREMRAEEE